MRRQFVWILGMLATGLVAGCEKQPDTPQVKEPSTAAHDRPTTQQILATPRHVIQLGSFPLRLNVPVSWTIKSSNASSKEPVPAPVVPTLQGPSPSGEVMIALIGPNAAAQSLQYSSDQIDREIERLQSDQKLHPDKYAMVPQAPRTNGKAKIIEYRVIEPALPETINEQGEKLLAVAAGIHWDIGVYVPVGDKQKYQRYRLDLRMPLRQYEADKAFLEDIMGSLQFDPLLVPADAGHQSMENDLLGPK